MSPSMARKQLPAAGPNRTGIGAAPERAAEMLQGMEEFPPNSHGDGTEPATVREAYAKEGVPVGSIPETGGDGSAVPGKLAPLLDKLGARLAFERVGTRLYDALIGKHDAYGGFTGGPSRADLEELREEEHRHFLMLQSAIEELGGDATALTPSGDLELVTGRGIPDVLVDPRTTLLQSLEAVLVAELADHECWQALAELTAAGGHDELAEECRTALAQEMEHLRKVRNWVAAGQGRSGT